MKKIITLLSITVMTFTASASQQLYLETKIIKQQAKDGSVVLSAPKITVENGQEATLQIGKIEYEVTPTLQQDGMVEIRAVLTESDGAKIEKLMAPRVTTKLGDEAVISISKHSGYCLTYKIKVSLEK